MLQEALVTRNTQMVVVGIVLTNQEEEVMVNRTYQKM